MKKELEDAIASYHKSIESVRAFEAKLREARQAEAAAVNDDYGDEKKIVKAVAEAQGLQAVYSRRLELARQKIPEVFAEIPPIVKGLAQDLADRCYALAAERAARHREVFHARLDLETFHRQFLSSLPAFPVDFQSDVDRLVDCCADVINAKGCVPRLNFLLVPAMLSDNFTFEKLQLDLDNLEKAEVAFEAEAAREYPFEEPAEALAAEKVEV